MAEFSEVVRIEDKRAEVGPLVLAAGLARLSPDEPHDDRWAVVIDRPDGLTFRTSDGTTYRVTVKREEQSNG